MYLIILWFGFSKNADLTYMPEWAKKDTARFRLAVGPDGGVVPMMSVHCEETIEADKRAFMELISCIKAEDEAERTVFGGTGGKMRLGIIPLTVVILKKRRRISIKEFLKN